MIFGHYSASNTASMGGVASAAGTHDRASNTLHRNVSFSNRIKLQFQSRARMYVFFSSFDCDYLSNFHPWPVSPRPFPEYDGCFITGAPGTNRVMINYMLALAWDICTLKLYFESSTVQLIGLRSHLDSDRHPRFPRLFVPSHILLHS
jgi:hypothetical protein